MTNELRMPFAEWYFRMSERDVPYQARGLAVAAVIYKVTANDRLAQLAGMDMKGLADKTFNRWKRALTDCGVVIIKTVTIGRVTTVEVIPAVDGTPVTFTDITPRDPAKFGQSKSYGREVEVTGNSYVPTVKVTDEIVKVTAETVEVTDEIENLPCAHTRAEVSNIYNIINNLPTNTPSPSEQDAAREGEEAVGFGVFVNCETIRHKAFTINLKGIECQLLGTVPMDEIKQVSLGHALQWATDIADGKTNVVPKNTASFIRQSIQNQKTKAAHLDYRPSDGRRSGKQVPRPAGKSFAQLNDEILSEIEREKSR